MSAARHPKREFDSTFKAACKFKSFFFAKNKFRNNWSLTVVFIFNSLSWTSLFTNFLRFSSLKPAFTVKIHSKH